MRAMCSANPIALEFTTRIIFGEECRSWTSSPCIPLQLLLRPNIFLTTLFSNTLSLRFSLTKRNQVSHPYKHKTRVLYYSKLGYFNFRYKTGKDPGPNGSRHSLNSICSYFLHECKCDLLVSIPNIWHCHYGNRTLNAVFTKASLLVPVFGHTNLSASVSLRFIPASFSRDQVCQVVRPVSQISGTAVLMYISTFCSC
jgi:hypothetical protein